MVTDAAGQTVSFVVQEIRTYRETDSAGEVFSSSGASQLRLITCAGAWDKTQKRFVKRLVVFADKAK